MRRHSRLISVAAVVGATALLTPLGLASPAAASGGPCEDRFSCEDGGDVIISPGAPGGGGSGGGGNTGGGGASQCLEGGAIVPCTSEYGSWSSALGCYLMVEPNPPAAGSGFYEGENDPANGTVYRCSSSSGLLLSYRVLQDGPDLPSPAELAQQALERMDLEPISIGIAPEDSADSLGLVGLPTWLWVDNPTPNTYGPITESATAGPITVTATAEVASIVWDMGDGQSVTCTNPGTPYQRSFGVRDSPSCGYRYATTSGNQPNDRYTITATTNWVVEWAGGGQSGQIEISHAANAQLRVGEMQVLVQ